MIELIFVIVIIGILSGVALPKFAATRGDAKGAVILSALTNCIQDAGNEFMVTSSFGHLTEEGNDTSINCRDAWQCFAFTEDDANGSLTVAEVNASTAACQAAQKIASENLLSTTHTINF